ncbi:MAG TPA: L-fucose/L-arabinose isomerase family protein [Terriglobia bacterium]|nr:L-fucose/L-arabinose isomerase family protein [Terriglobia bacterium]
MRKRRIGLLTFSDGRKFAHEMLREMNLEFQNKFRARLEATGEYEVVAGGEIVWHPEVAKREGRRLLQAGVEATVLNYAVWCFPHLTMMATEFAPGPYLMFSNINPSYPGMVGMLAAAGGMDQVGRAHGRAQGDIADDRVLARVQKFLRAAVAVSRLKGETFGLYGGRPMGMYTAVANADQWKRDFGIDVEHIDQYEIIRRSDLVEPGKVENAFSWLEKMLGKNIHYDGKKLTPVLLKRQIRSYYACQEINREKAIDFFGIKAQPEMTDNFTTEDIIDAFSNDPYDWDGPKEPVVCATEADMDGALTMELFKHVTGEPVLFADVRHYDAEDNFFDLCNSGAHATFFAGRSRKPEDNLRQVHFWPEIFYFPAGGASVMHFAQPGEVTLARLTRRNGKYWMAIVPGEFIQFDEKKNWAKAEATTQEWPHAFARFQVSADEFLATYDSNHIHGCYGNWVDEMVEIAKILKIDYHIYV